MRKTVARPTVSSQPLYEALREVNLHFDHIRAQAERLSKLPIFRGRSGRRFLPAFNDAVSEARAWFNTEILEAQGDVESREWARLDLRRARREKGFREAEAMPRQRKKPGASARVRWRRSVKQFA
jgi:hypothetical protein